MMRSLVNLSLIIPVYNEFNAIRPFVEKIDSIFSGHSEVLIEMVFVNDGSTDGSLELLEKLLSSRADILVIDLSRNFGKEAALTAGLRSATGDIVVPIDADLQDPPELILKMIEKWREGYEVVLARRADRSKDSFLKRFTATIFYQLHNMISTPKIPRDVGDFRLMDRIVVDSINSLSENTRYMKGLFSWVGFRTTTIDYVRQERSFGVSKLNGLRLLNLAIEGFTNFSMVPLQLWTILGCIISLVSFLFGGYVVLVYVCTGIEIPGYPSLIVSVAFLGGLQLIGIGVLGEYIGRCYMEAKDRPCYIIRKVSGKPKW